MKADSIISLFISAWCLTLSGCLDTSGISPPSDQLIFPVGIVTTASDEYLLAANSNFDLMYNAGTMVAISLNKLDKILEEGGKAEWLSPDKKFMYVPESELIDTKDTIRLDAYASDLELTPKQNRALIPIRGGAERHILIVDVDETAQSGSVLRCGQDDTLFCDSAHRVTSNDRVTLPIEPYEVTSLDYSQPIFDSTGAKIPLPNTLGFATHLESGSVSAFIIDDSNGNLDAELFDVVSNVVPEASGIAANPKTNEIYVTGRENSDQYMAILRVLSGGVGGTDTNKPFFGVVDKINYGSDILGGTDTRGVAVPSGGKQILVVSRTPEALLRYDATTRKMIDMATLGSDPSVVAIYEDKGESETEYDDSVYAFVLCFKSNQVFIVEPEMMQVVVRSTGSGPQAITFDKTRKLAYIANFSESTITVLETEPPFKQVLMETEPPFKRVLSGEDNAHAAQLMIGKPRLTGNH